MKYKITLDKKLLDNQDIDFFHYGQTYELAKCELGTFYITSCGELKCEFTNEEKGIQTRNYDDIVRYYVRNNDEYLQFMYERLNIMYSLLSDTGSIYVHCDYRMTAYFRLILDEIFGSSGFKNEIIWSYKTGGTTKKYFNRKHDTIYLYTKTDNFYYNNIKEKAIVDKSKGYNPNTEQFIDE